MDLRLTFHVWIGGIKMDSFCKSWPQVIFLSHLVLQIDGFSSKGSSILGQTVTMIVLLYNFTYLTVYVKHII